MTNNKLYIGSSKTLSTGDRFNKHLDGSRSNIQLKRAVNKYTWANFTFVIFEYCKPEDLLVREQYYL